MTWPFEAENVTYVGRPQPITLRKYDDNDNDDDDEIKIVILNVVPGAKLGSAFQYKPACAFEEFN